MCVHPETRIEEWHDAHPRFAVLKSFIRRLGQQEWTTLTADWHRSSHLLVARQGETLAGFLPYVIQPIGPDMDCPPVQHRGADLLEAKVLAFAVDKPY